MCVVFRASLVECQLRHSNCLVQVRLVCNRCVVEDGVVLTRLLVRLLVCRSTFLPIYLQLPVRLSLRRVRVKNV